MHSVDFATPQGSQRQNVVSTLGQAQVGLRIVDVQQDAWIMDRHKLSNLSISADHGVRTFLRTERQQFRKQLTPNYHGMAAPAPAILNTMLSHVGTIDGPCSFSTVRRMNGCLSSGPTPRTPSPRLIP